MRNILAAVALLLSCAAAHAQALITIELPPLSGAAIGSGYSMANGQLFVPTSASLQSMAFPFTISFDLVSPSPPLSGAAVGSYVTTGSSSPGSGFIIEYNPTTSIDLYHFQAQVRPSSVFSTSACTVGKMCWRQQLDNTRHHYCHVFTANHAWMYIDGILRDEITNVGSYTPSTSLWNILQNGQIPPNNTIFDVRAYNKALTADECVYVSRLNQANLIPNSGSTNTDLLLSLPLNNCVVSGAEYTCADASGNSNNATNARSPPVVVVTAPSPGTVSGAVSMQATCTDPSTTTCTQVCYLVDNVQVSSSCPTVAPYTFSWDSTKIIDGSHTITAVGFNIAGTTGISAGVAVTTSNGVSAKTVWLNSSTGSDSNNCLSSGTACLTFAHIRSAITFLGGDTFNVIGTFTNSAAFVLCGPIGGCGTQNFYPSGATLTMTTTGACNPFTETTTGCAIINVSGATDGIDVVNGTNVTVENMAVLGPAVVPLANFGIQITSSLPAYTSSTGVTVTNNIVKNFGYDIDIGVLSGSGASLVTGYVVSDNWVTSATHVNPGPLSCIRANGGTQGTIQANLATQCGGQSGNNGNGIVVFNYPAPVSGTSTMQFNVNHDFGWNNTPNTGGPVGIYITNASNVLAQFNESYNGIPNPAFYNGSNAIDFDCFDMDNGATNATEQYNYAHNCPVQAAFNIVNNAFGGGNPNWNNNTIRYNVGENVQQCFPMFGNATTTNSYVYNNTCATNVTSSPTFPVCWNGPQPIVVANNLCIWTGSAARVYVNVAYNSLPLPAGMIWLNNDYYATASSPSWLFNKIFQSQTFYSTLAAFQTATVDANHASGLDANSLNVNPMIAGTPGTGGTCYTDASGSPPAGPQPCPNGIYQLTTGSPLIGVGLDLTQAPYSQSVGTRDYWGTSIPNGVGTGYNIGADGAHH